MIGLTLNLRRSSRRPDARGGPRHSRAASFRSRRAASSPSPASACSCSTRSRWGCSGGSSSRRSGVDGGAGRAHQVRICARMARRRNAAQGISVGQRRRMAGRRRAPSYDSGSRARGGDARLGQQRRARRRGHLARLVRGRAASAASRPGGRAGVLDAHGLRQRLHVVRLRQRDHRHRRSLPRQRRCGLPRRRPLERGVGAGTRDASARSTRRRPAWMRR